MIFSSLFNKLYGRSNKWNKVRSEFLRHNSVCAACGTNKDLEVHHIVPYHLDSTKELEYTNLITLCGKRCHFIFGHLCDWKSWNVDVVNDCKKYNYKLTNRPYELTNDERVSLNINGDKHAISNFFNIANIKHRLFSWNNRSRNK